MYKKTLSKNTFKERNEVSLMQQFAQLSAICQTLIRRYPFYFLIGMLSCILTSAILAFTVMREEDSSKLPAFPGFATEGITKSATAIIGSYSAMNELEELQRNITVIINKDSLSDRDSAQLTHALKRYKQIQRSLISTVDTPSIP